MHHTSTPQDESDGSLPEVVLTQPFPFLVAVQVITLAIMLTGPRHHNLDARLLCSALCTAFLLVCFWRLPRLLPASLEHCCLRRLRTYDPNDDNDRLDGSNNNNMDPWK